MKSFHLSSGSDELGDELGDVSDPEIHLRAEAGHDAVEGPLHPPKTGKRYGGQMRDELGGRYGPTRCFKCHGYGTPGGAME